MSKSENGEDRTSRIGSVRPWRQELLLRHRWLTFVLPFVVFLAITALEPIPGSPQPEFLGWTISYSSYPCIYATKITLTLAAIVFVLPGYRKFPLRVSPIAGPLVGVIGAGVWIAACEAKLESRFLMPALESLHLSWLLPSGLRSAFNPFEQFSESPTLAVAFMGLRLVGLVAVVPVMEELFLRGFAMRFVMADDWWNVPFGKVAPLAVVVGTVVPMLTHSSELLAAALWFSMVTLLMVKTRNIWDCVLAHAVTNLLLGAYVIAFGKWELL